MMRETLITTRAGEYFDRSGLRTLTGLPEELWNIAVLKEILDNGLDAINELSEKRITVEITSDTLFIADNGSGIPQATLDQVFNFDVYASSKRDYRTTTRGFQGNALKTIIGIAQLNGYELAFFTENKKITYTINPLKLKSGLVVFDKSVELSDCLNGVRLTGIDVTSHIGWIQSYRQANPDVSFLVNGEEFPAVIAAVKRAEKTFVHWYDFKAFSSLLQKIHTKDPDRTVKAFIGEFSGTQRIKSRLDFPHKRLNQFDSNEQAIKDLYVQLRELTEAPKPTVLDKQATGKDAFLRIFGVEDGRYKKIRGAYAQDGAVIPYIIEGFLYRRDQCDKIFSKVMTSVNNSITYDELPFKFSGYCFGTIAGKQYSGLSMSLSDIVSASGFTKAEGVAFCVNFISPVLNFLDKAKTRIIADRFKTDLLKVLESCCGEAIKEVARAEREHRRQDRERAIKHVKNDPKKTLMKRYFMEAYERASGGYSSVKARQIFYVLRELVNRKHDVDLRQSDYGVFTQKTVTYFLDKHPGLESKIFFERRGFFSDPFSGEETALGTDDVLGFIRGEQGVNRGILERTSHTYSLPVSLRYNHVLFIEKQGFTGVMRESGLIKRLNLGVLSTQGFGTRAAKKFLQWHLEHGVKVYVLHDCDISGYMIHDKMAHGSSTFKQGLNVVDLGLTVADVHELGKEHQAEVTVKKKPHTRDFLDSILSQEEKDFFVKNSWTGEYRRVELNVLRNSEFLEFVEKKIRAVQPEPIKPSIEDLKRFVKVDAKEIVKKALYNAFWEHHKFVPNLDELIQSIHGEINGRTHWTNTVESSVDEWKEEQVEKLTLDIRKSWGLINH